MKKGFTLIELLVVIAIIGILSAVVLASLNSARGKANDSSKITGAREVAKALEVSRNQSTGLFTGYSNTAAASVGLQEFIAVWPTGVEYLDNTSDLQEYCVYAVLTESNANYIVASSNGTGYRATLPTLADCAID